MYSTPSEGQVCVLTPKSSTAFYLLQELGYPLVFRPIWNVYWWAFSSRGALESSQWEREMSNCLHLVGFSCMMFGYPCCQFIKNRLQAWAMAHSSEIVISSTYFHLAWWVRRHYGYQSRILWDPTQVHGPLHKSTISKGIAIVDISPYASFQEIQDPGYEYQPHTQINEASCC